MKNEKVLCKFKRKYNLINRKNKIGDNKMKYNILC